MRGYNVIHHDRRRDIERIEGLEPLQANGRAAQVDWRTGGTVDQYHVDGIRHPAQIPVVRVIPVAARRGHPFDRRFGDLESADDLSCVTECVACTVGDHVAIDNETVTALRQRRQGHRHDLATGTEGYVDGANRVAARVKQAEVVGGDSGGVERLAETQAHGAEGLGVARPVGDVAGNDRWRKGIGDKVDDEGVRKRRVAAGVGGARLDGGGGRGRQGGQRDGRAPGEGDVVGDHLTVEQQLDVAYLLIVVDVELDVYQRAFECLNTRRHRVAVGLWRTEGDRRRLSLVVEGQVVDHLQATRPAGYEGDARTDRNVEGTRRQVDAGQEGTGVGWVAEIDDVEPGAQQGREELELANGDAQAGAVGDDRLAFQVVVVYFAEQGHRRGVGDVGGDEAAGIAIPGADVGDGVADEEFPVRGGEVEAAQHGHR